MRRIMSSKPQTAATVRTTTALTVLNAGHQANVMPTTASALVNHRIHPADCCDGILQFDRAVICDHRVKVERKGRGIEPSPISSSSSRGFRAIHESVLAVYPHVSVAPAVVVGGTDSKWYVDLCDNMYRFSCIFMSDPRETSMFHGRDESITRDCYVKAVMFFFTLMIKCSEHRQETDEATASRRESKKQL